MRRLFAAITTVLLVISVAGCSVVAQRRTDALNETLNAYASTVRWVGWAQANQFVDPKYREKHPLTDLDRARYSQVRVSEYDAGDGPIPVDDNHVRQLVKINLINRHTQTERSIVDRQLWKYDEKTNHWWLESGLPDITRNQ